MSLDLFLPILLSGIVLGSLYAMMATGLSLIWSTLGIFNFAHGVLMTLGAYVAWQVGTEGGFGLGVSAGLAVGVAVAAGCGLLIWKGLVEPFMGRKDVVLLAVITTLAAAVFIENSALLAWGGRIKRLPPLVEGSLGFFGLQISIQEALIIVLAPSILVALWLFLKHSTHGQALRAVGQNRDAALLVGLKVRRYYALAFALAAGLAGLAGIFLGSLRFVTPVMGAEPLVKALIITIFGGLGSLAGTVLGAYAIGLLEAICIFWIGLYWTPASLFLLMILVLMVRPTGLLGRA